MMMMLSTRKERADNDAIYEDRTRFCWCYPQGQKLCHRTCRCGWEDCQNIDFKLLYDCYSWWNTFDRLIGQFCQWLLISAIFCSSATYNNCFVFEIKKIGLKSKEVSTNLSSTMCVLCPFSNITVINVNTRQTLSLEVMLLVNFHRDAYCFE